MPRDADPAETQDFRIESSGGFSRLPLRILAEAMPLEGIDATRFARQVLLDPNFDPAGSLVAITTRTPSGDPSSLDFGYRGYILAIARKIPLENAPDDSERGYITLFGVRPEARNRGLGSALLNAAEEFLRQRGCRTAMISPYAPGYFIPGVDVAAYSTGLEFLKKRGYTEVYRPLAMERSLWDYVHPAEVPEIVKAGRPEIYYDSGRQARSRITEILSFVSEVFPGDWVRVVRECLHDIWSGDREDRLHVAVEVPPNAPTRVIGFSHYRAERFGPIGVHPDCRGRGIGKVLTHATLRAQQQAGYRSSWFLWTDDQTANRLYQPAGFREVRRFAVLRKELGPPSPSQGEGPGEGFRK